jgi:hypothetical protein
MNTRQQRHYDRIADLVREKGFSVIGNYTNQRTDILLCCPMGHEINVTPMSITQNHLRCRLCPTKKEADFVSLVEDKGGCVLGKYTGIFNRVLILCEKGHETLMIPTCVKNGSWCNHCRKEKALSSPAHKESMNRFYKTIEQTEHIVTGEYINTSTKIEVMCRNNHTRTVRPKSFSQNPGCKVCLGRDYESCKNRLKSYVESKNGILLSEYTNSYSYSYVLIRCHNDHEFSAHPSKMVYNRSWCSVCEASNGERETGEMLKILGIKYERQFRLKCTRRKSYDYYFSINNSEFLLEYDGKQHFQFIKHFHRTEDNFEIQQNVDRLKTYAAINMGYNMIRIDYKSRDRICEIIKAAILEPKTLYLSNPDMYEWLFEGLDTCFIANNCATEYMNVIEDNDIPLY